MNRAVVMVVCVWAAGGVSAAAERGTAERHAARWARVTEEANVQLVADQVRAAVEGRVPEGIVRRHLAEGITLGALRSAPAGAATVRRDASAVEMEGVTAAVRSPQGTLTLNRGEGGWRVTAGAVAVRADETTPGGSAVKGAEAGATFVRKPISEEHGIDRLSRGVTVSKIDRKLFGLAGKTASFYTAHYRQTAPFVTATYLQFVVDQAWNRLLYGNLDRWIRSYDALSGPSAVATDADGRVFVAETGARRVSVLRVVGEGDEARLQPVYVIGGVRSPNDIAHSDNGTPLATGDDVLYVADASRQRVLKYRLGDGAASPVAEFEGFDSPTALAVGRWNGAANGLLVVVDRVGKRVRVFEDRGTSLTPLCEMRGTYDRYFSAVRTDHFGNIYLTDNVNGEVLKYTSSLEYLDADGGRDAFAAPAAVDIPFGRITIDGQGTFWAGFDQMFAVERWSESTGAQRRTLGLRLRDVAFRADEVSGAVRTGFVLTDAAELSANVYDEQNRLVRSLEGGWKVAGGREIVWDRRDDAGRQVAPGAYRFELSAATAYTRERVVSRTRLTLPLYYNEDCGSPRAEEDAHRVQGTPVRWGSGASETAVEHSQMVRYRFAGLDPAAEYAVEAEYASADGAVRMQEMTAGGMRLHEAVAVGSAPAWTGALTVPREAYASGVLEVSVNRRGEGSAVVTQLRLVQKNTGLGAEPVTAEVPAAFALEQNYPIPFNPATVIRFAIPADGDVSMKVYDVAGREVATLLNEQRRAGAYEVRFDAQSAGRNLASGVYFYRLQVRPAAGASSAAFSETRKMVLVK